MTAVTSLAQTESVEKHCLNAAKSFCVHLYHTSHMFVVLSLVYCTHI